MTSTRSDLEKTAEQKVMGSPATTTAATTGTSSVAAASAPLASTSATGADATCSRQYFTTTEDRPVVREQVTIIKEHHPVQKEFVVEAKATGRERALDAPVASEVIGSTVREVAGPTVVAPAVTPTIVAQPAVTSQAVGQPGASQTTTSTGTTTGTNLL